jgi:hypothetical protein
VDEEVGIATKTSLSVDQSLNLGTLLQRRTQVRGPHSLHPLELQAEEAGADMVRDDEDGVGGGDG